MRLIPLAYLLLVGTPVLSLPAAPLRELHGGEPSTSREDPSAPVHSSPPEPANNPSPPAAPPPPAASLPPAAPPPPAASPPPPSPVAYPYPAPNPYPYYGPVVQPQPYQTGSTNWGKVALGAVAGAAVMPLAMPLVNGLIKPQQPSSTPQPGVVPQPGVAPQAGVAPQPGYARRRNERA